MKRNTRMENLLKRTKKKIDKIEQYEGEKVVQEIKKNIRHFIRFYQFLLQATCYKDEEIHKNYNFLFYLSKLLTADDGGAGFSLKDQIEATIVKQQKGPTYIQSHIHSDPALKLPKADRAFATDENEKKLSEILDEINKRFDENFETDAAMKWAMAVKDQLMKSDKLKRSAKSNSFEDFERYAVADELDNAIMASLDENYTFFKMLLENDKYKEEIMKIFTPEIFRQLNKNEDN